MWESDLRRGRRTEVLRIYVPVPPGRLHPSSGPGYARSTFPAGEGDLRRGRRTEVLRIYAPVPPGRLRADVGIRPYARERAEAGGT